MNLALIIHEEGRLDEYKRWLDLHAVQTVEGSPFADPIELCRLHSPQVIVLEAQQPYSVALDFCRRLRSHPAPESTAILLVAAGMPEADRVAALELGANDCVSADMSPREFLAHVKVQLRRPWSIASRLQCGPLDLDLARGQVLISGRTVSLTPTEVRLLRVLMQRVGVVFTCRQLVEAVWEPDSPVTICNIRTHVAHLRRKLEAPSPRGRLIRSVRGFGYWLDCGGLDDLDRAGDGARSTVESGGSHDSHRGASELPGGAG